MTERTKFFDTAVLHAMGDGILPDTAFRRLLSVTAARAAPGSDLAASISTSPDDETDEEAAVRKARDQELSAAGDAVLTVPSRETALRWLEAAGWSTKTVTDLADLSPGSRRGRLLVLARR